MAAVSLRDVRQVLRAALLSDSVVSGLVDGRGVYTHHFVDPDRATGLMPMFIIQTTGGAVAHNRVVHETAFHLYSYSKTSADEATELYDAAFARFQSECVDAGADGPDLKLLLREVERPSDGYNDQIQAWFMRGRWIAWGVA